MERLRTVYEKYGNSMAIVLKHIKKNKCDEIK